MPDVSTPISMESYECERDENPFLPIISCTDIFAPTWLCSYVRFVEIELGSNMNSNARLLAYVLMRQQESREVPAWLWESYLVPSTADDLSGFVGRVLRDIDSGGRDDVDRPNHQLKAVLETLDFSRCTEIFCVSSRSDKVWTLDMHKYGPTYMFIWRDSTKFRFIEIHNES